MADKTIVLYEGKDYEVDDKPGEADDRAFMASRALAEKLGVSISWDASKGVVIFNGSVEIKPYKMDYPTSGSSAVALRDTVPGLCSNCAWKAGAQEGQSTVTLTVAGDSGGTGDAEPPMDDTSDIVPDWRKTRSAYHCQIGDSIFFIPPTFIDIKKVDEAQQSHTLRHANSLKTKSGKVSTEINMELYFCGAQQINGYKIPGPEGGNYYMDGLLALIAQFKRCPILPIRNNFINHAWDIWNAVLVSMNISTLDGFPNVLVVNLVMHATTVMPYTMNEDSYYDSMIEYPIFRWYYQQMCMEAGTTTKTVPGETKSAKLNPGEYGWADGDETCGRTTIQALKLTQILGMPAPSLDGDVLTIGDFKYDDNSTYNDPENGRVFKVKQGIVDGRSMVLTRKVAEDNGWLVGWDGATATISFTKKNADSTYTESTRHSRTVLQPVPERMNGDFTFRVMDTQVLDGEDEAALYNPSLMQEIKIPHVKDAITSVHISLQNVITNHWVEMHNMPCHQVLGSMDTFFLLEIETANMEAVRQFMNLQKITEQFSVMYRDRYVSGYCKVENELFQMMGVNYCMIESLEVKTVPENPGDFQISMLLISYDYDQRKQETASAWKPFIEDGSTDVFKEVESVWAGDMAKTIHHQVAAEKMMNDLELYPDLDLPRWKDVNDGVNAINAQRKQYNLPEIKFKPYGAGIGWDKGTFVDPDFYIKYKDLTQGGVFNATEINMSITGGNLWVDQQATGSGSGQGGQLMMPLEGWDPNNVSPQGNFGDPRPNSAYINYHTGVDWYCGEGQDVKAADSGTVDIAKDKGDTSYGKYIRISHSNGLFTLYAHLSEMLVNEGDQVTRGQVIAKSGNSGGSDGAHLHFEVQEGSYNYVNPIPYLTGGGGSQGNGVGTGQFIFPVESGNITRGFSADGTGCDIQASSGDPVYAADGGVICNSEALRNNDGSYRSYGEYIRIDHQNGFYSLYAHLQQRLVNEGDMVSKGQQIGYADSTGHSTGDHLHFEICQGGPRAYVDPVPFLDGAQLPSAYTGGQGGKDDVYQGPDGQDKTLFEIACYYNDTNGLPKYLVPAIIEQESHWTNEQPNYANCSGLPQFLESNWRAAGYSSLDEWLGDPVGQIKCCAEFIRDGLQQFDGNLENALAAYNWGSGNVQNALSQGKTFPFGPEETRNYVPGVLGYMEQFGGGWTGSSGAGDTATGSSAAAGAAVGSGKRPRANVDTSKLPGWVKVTSVSNYSVPYGHAPLAPDPDTTEGLNKLVEMMAHDSLMYSTQGRMVQAFPSFAMVFLDEGLWTGTKRVWTNFYAYHSAISIEVVRDRKNPADLALISLTNIYGTLNTKSRVTGKEPGFWEALFPRLKDDMVAARQNLMKDLDIKPGCRVHLRMGYGSCAGNLPTVFNGVIAEMGGTNEFTIVCQGDGVELLDPMVDYADPEASTGYWTGGLSPYELFYWIMASRGFWNGQMFIAKLVGGIAAGGSDNYIFGQANPYGIEHFGTISYDNGYYFDIVTDSQPSSVDAGADYLKSYDVMKNIYNTEQNNGNPSHFKDGDDWYRTPYGMIEPKKYSNDISGKLEEMWNDTKTVFERISHAIGVGQDYDPELGVGEIRLYIGGKTPWDIFTLTTKSQRGYICAVHPYHFRSTLFFGKPWWPIKYGVELKPGGNANNKDDYRELVKPFKQFHRSSSWTDILDNGVIASGKHIVTNCCSLYTRAGTKCPSKVIKADSSIKTELQKTEIIDSSIVHDTILLPNSFYIEEAIGTILGNKVGEDAAKQMAISNIRDKFKEMYQGEIIMRGNPAPKPYDCIHIDDQYNKISGMADVGRIVHQMGFDTGFITSIKPDLCVTENEEAMNNIFISWQGVYTTWALATSLWIGVAYARGILTRKGLAAAGKDAITAFRGLVGKAGATIKKAKNLVKDIRMAGRAVEVACIETGAEAGTVAPGIGNALGALLGFVVGEIVTYMVFDTAISLIEDYFLWSTGCIKIYPLWKKKMPFVAGIDGHRRLIPGLADPWYYPDPVAASKTTPMDPMGMFETFADGFKKMVEKVIQEIAETVDNIQLDGSWQTDNWKYNPDVGVTDLQWKIGAQLPWPYTAMKTTDGIFGFIKKEFGMAIEAIKTDRKVFNMITGDDEETKSLIMSGENGPMFARWPTHRMTYVNQGNMENYKNHPGQIVGHNGRIGAMLTGQKGDAVYPILSGVVSKIDYNDQFGNYIVMDHPGYTVQSFYCHLDAAVAAPNEFYNCINGNWKKPIATLGDTGSAEGIPHLHLIMIDMSTGQELDPVLYLPPPN